MIFPIAIIKISVNIYAALCWSIPYILIAPSHASLRSLQIHQMEYINKQKEPNQTKRRKEIKNRIVEEE